MTLLNEVKKHDTILYHLTNPIIQWDLIHTVAKRRVHPNTKNVTSEIKIQSEHFFILMMEFREK